MFRHASVVRPPLSKIFASETTGTVKAKFHVKSPWEGGTKVCINGPYHMAKMAAMPIYVNQRTNGPVKAHLISWPSKAQNIQNLENIWYRNDLDLQYSPTFILNSIKCLHLPLFRSLAAIVSEKSTVFTFSYRT